MDINSSFQIGALTFANRLIQGPLAGYTCAPYRATFAAFQQPAYCVSEMISAHDLLHRQPARFVSRDPKEKYLAYQLSGYDPDVMAKAASKRLLELGYDGVFTIRGGIKAWQREGYELQKDSAIVAPPK